MATDIDLIWAGGEANYFFNEDWTGQITLKAFRKLVFARRAFSTKFRAEKVDQFRLPDRDTKGRDPMTSEWSTDVRFGAHSGLESDIA
jgi:hypothetical protein